MIQYRILTLDNFDPKPYHCLFKDIPNQEMVSLDQVGEEGWILAAITNSGWIFTKTINEETND
jgi:hypothetical protein